MSILTHIDGLSASLLDAARKALDESNEYQKKVQAHMAKKGIKSLNDLTADQKKKFFNELDAMHKAKNEEVESVSEGEDKLKGTPVVSLKDLDDKKDTKKDKYGRIVPKKLKKDDKRVKFYKETKDEDVKEEADLEEGFSDAQIGQLRAEMGKISGIDPASPTYKRLVDMLDNMGMKELTKLADANIKFISGLARNRVIRSGMKKEEVELEEAPYMGKGNHRPGWMLRADPELAKKFKEIEDRKKTKAKTVGKTSDEIAKMKKEEVEIIEAKVGDTVSFHHELKAAPGTKTKKSGTVEKVQGDDVHVKVKDKYGVKRHQIKMSDIVKEEVELEEEQLDELSKTTLKSYGKKALAAASSHVEKSRSSIEKAKDAYSRGSETEAEKHYNDAKKQKQKSDQRIVGAATAIKKIGQRNEEVELEEGSSTSRTPFMKLDDPKRKAAASKMKDKMEKEKAAEPGKKLLAKIGKKGVKEEVELDEEQLQELDKSTLASYIKKRSHDVATQGALTRQYSNDTEAARKDQNYVQARKSDEKSNKAFEKGWKHRQNIAKAVDKLTKEELEFIESLNSKESTDE